MATATKTSNPNTNCLEGKQCPNCGSFDPFEVEVTTRVTLLDEGTDYPKDGSIFYDEDSQAECMRCQLSGPFSRSMSTPDDHLDFFSTFVATDCFWRSNRFVFEKLESEIDSSQGATLSSNEIMAILWPGLEEIGFNVELGKRKEEKIVVPVLFGARGRILKRFNADAYSPKAGWVLEVEAGRAVANNQFLKDIFQACMMHDVFHLALAVRNSYRGADDFAFIENFLETLFVSGRLQLPLKSILLIGY